MISVTVKHNTETAHRLPHIGGKCASIHGHSWWWSITASAPTVDTDGMVVEFGAFKRAVRGWLDHYVDHGAMLGAADPLLGAFRADGGKVLVFGDGPLVDDLAWPTVENAALLGARVGAAALAEVGAPPHVIITEVVVTETHVNAARWTP